jgi:hypothetical protein
MLPWHNMLLIGINYCGIFGTVFFKLSSILSPTMTPSIDRCNLKLVIGSGCAFIIDKLPF